MGQCKDFKEIQDLTIVNNRFCWLLGVVAELKNIGVILLIKKLVTLRIRKF